MRIRARCRKFAEFLTCPRLTDIALHPWPWRRRIPAYYIVNPVNDSDGHGGYARDHAFDEHGIPYQLVRGRRRYAPLTVARYVLKVFAVADAAGNSLPIDRVRQFLPLLTEAGSPTGVWDCGPHPAAMTGQQPSGIVQAYMISAILRLADGRPDARVGDLLDRAWRRMSAPIDKGGALGSLGGSPFIEERPSSGATHNFGGNVDGLLACYDLADKLGHGPAGRLAVQLEDGIAHNLAKFTLPLGWSRYVLDLRGYRLISSLHYHQYYTARLRLLALRTGRTEFARTADEWERALVSAPRRVTVGLAKSLQVLFLRGLLRVPMQEG